MKLSLVSCPCLHCPQQGVYIKRMVGVRNYSTNTIMEKNKHGEREARVKDMEFSGIK